MAIEEDDQRAAHVTSKLAEHIGRQYLFYFFAILVFGYLFPFIAERVPPLNRWAVSPFGQLLDSGYGLTGDNADVVVFGDSSAIFGVDTERLSRELGMKVTVLPGTIGSLPVTGDRTLQLYLKGNRPPRLIVFYFATWNLDFNHVLDSLTYEGDEQVVRHEPLSYLVKAAVKRPDDILAFPFRFYSVPGKLSALLDKGQFHPNPSVRGFSPYPGTSPLPATCSLPDGVLHPPATETVQKLVRDFTSEQTKTLVYLSPLPACQHAEEVAAQRLPGIDAAQPAILPASDFADQDRFVHALAPSSSATTDVLGAAIRQALQK